MIKPEFKHLRKLYYSQGEASKITGLEGYVLRYWEQEFPDSLRVQKNRAGRRLYSTNNIKTIMAIKAMFREERLTIEQTRQELKKRAIVDPPEQPELPL